MKPKQLEEILSSLIAAFGHGKVQNTLDSLKSRRPVSGQSRKDYKWATPTRGNARLNPTKRRGAVALVKSMDLNDSEKEAIIFDMAQRYEAKKFMPNVNHVRAFLESLGEDVSRVKSRQQVTVSVFKKLAEMETPVLRDMRDRGLYGPPMTLGPIADAIGRFGQSRRSRSQ